MKKKTYYMKFYNEWAKDGRMSDRRGWANGGLCQTILCDDVDLFIRAPYGGYWGYDGDPLTSVRGDFQKALERRGITEDDAKYAFTPFRQTVVLLLAAVNDEL